MKAGEVYSVQLPGFFCAQGAAAIVSRYLLILSPEHVETGEQGVKCSLSRFYADSTSLLGFVTYARSRCLASYPTVSRQKENTSSERGLCHPLLSLGPNRRREWSSPIWLQDSSVCREEAAYGLSKRIRDRPHKKIKKDWPHKKIKNKDAND